MTHVTCRLTDKNLDQLRNSIRSVIEYGLPLPFLQKRAYSVYVVAKFRYSLNNETFLCNPNLDSTLILVHFSAYSPRHIDSPRPRRQSRGRKSFFVKKDNDE